MSSSSSITVSAPRQGERACRLIEWKPWLLGNSSLLGHATVSFSGWIVHRVPVFRRADGTLSVGTPNAPEVDAEGRIKLRDGKKQYLPVLSFETSEARERWQRMVLGALAAAGITGAPEAAP
jgi:hypothetical protein